jgi:hypothetical protein
MRLEPRTAMHPPIDTLLPVHNSGALYPILQPKTNSLSRSHEQGPGLSEIIDSLSTPWAPFPISQSLQLPTETGRMYSYNHVRLHACLRVLSLNCTWWIVILAFFRESCRQEQDHGKQETDDRTKKV